MTPVPEIDPHAPAQPHAPAVRWTAGLSDSDLRTSMLAALRLVGLLAVLVAALFWWKAGARSALLVLIGAAISAASLWEWMRLMTAINLRMDAGGTPRPMGLVLVGFFLRIGLTLVALYASLKYLHGTALGLAAGLGLGVVALSVEALRLMKRWTV